MAKTDKSSSPNFLIGLVVSLVFVALLIAALTGGSDEGDPAEAFGTPTVEGTALPVFTGDTAGDAAVGSPAPVARGEDPGGDTVTVGSGNPQVIAFLAHWCPHCQAEVPVVVDWVAEGRLPDGVDLFAVATGTDEAQPNFPPTTWLDREEWPGPILLDDADDTVGQAFGLSSFPFWVAVDGDGTVVARAAGRLSPEQLDALAATVAP